MAFEELFFNEFTMYQYSELVLVTYLTASGFDVIVIMFLRDTDYAEE